MRPLSLLSNRQKAVSLATGEVFLGEEALKLGLVDSLGGLSSCIHDLRDLKPSTNDSNMAINLLAASSPETESLDQGVPPSHVTVEFPTFVRVVRLLRSKPTTASQPQQPWNILNWISTETQVISSDQQHMGLHPLWNLIGIPPRANFFTAPPTVTRSTLESSIWTPQHLQEDPHNCTREDKNVSPAISNDQVKRQSQTDNRWMMYGQYAFGQKTWSNPFEGLYDEGRRVSDEAVVYGVWPYPAQIEHRRSCSF
ncbi:hypothetical protein PROFUN_05680 [Planoprotostelium fungivorum]|uniref:Peptidase S49 domain-containing protein n=1 Tax=Planoprotostelium fungivorum TaxID=1890364 RepID=A0A2P6NQE5_9EUKA|nr:hypothetical protein PROFUN_05680 [Planoprotostelium fungivorum]